MKIIKKDSYWKRGWIPVSISIAIIWVSLIPLPALPEFRFIPVDKIGHLLAFLILGFIYLWSFDNPNTGYKLNSYKNRITFLITMIIGGTIEILQHYLPINRFGDWFDFFFDIGGIIIAIILYPMLKQKYLARFGLLFVLFFAIRANGQDAFTSPDGPGHSNEVWRFSKAIAPARTGPPGRPTPGSERY